MGIELIDRTDEVRRVSKALLRVTEGGAGGTLLLVGESGVGKTRLADELDRVATQHWQPLAHDAILALRARCTGPGEALIPIRDCLIPHLGRAGQRAAEMLRRAAPEFLELVPFIGSFLKGVTEAVTAGPPLGGSKGSGVYSSLADVLIGLAQARGLCLIVEDLQRADDETLNFLGFLLRKTLEHPVLMLCTSEDLEPLRPTFDEWVQQGASRVEITRLPRRFVGPLMTSLRGAEPTETEVNRMFAETGGNPFYVSQLVGDPDAGDVDVIMNRATGLPEAVLARLRLRLNRCDQAGRELLEAAAVALRHSAIPALVTHLARVDGDELDRLLRATSDVFVIDGERAALEPGLMRTFVYSQTIDHRRRRLHTQAGEWLRDLGHLSAAAHHFRDAGDDEALIGILGSAIARAEQEGTYRTALELHRLLPADFEQQFGARRCRTLLRLGLHDEAERLLRSLDQEDYEVRLAWSQLHFDRRDLPGAEDAARGALDVGSPSSIGALIQLADIHLYVGDLHQADFYASGALDEAERLEDPALIARCHGLMWATQHFGGRLEQADESLRKAFGIMDATAGDQLDQSVRATLQDNRGQSWEATGDWHSAAEYHLAALTSRTSVADAHGRLESLHALARCHLGRGDVDLAAARLGELEALRLDVGDPLESAKIDHTTATLAAARGDSERAELLLGTALSTFEAIGTAYDVGHGQLALARVQRLAGKERQAIEYGARGRSAVELSGFGLLSRLLPDEAFSYSDRIEAALIAYACGDALGLPWELLPPDRIDMDLVTSLPVNRPADWGRGATSDDTALTLLVSEYLAKCRQHSSASLLALLHEQRSRLVGLGPSTTAAINTFAATGRPPGDGGNTNGGAMRALPVGWAMPFADHDRRRESTITLTRATHNGCEAIAAACVMAACASWAVENASSDLLLEIAIDEASWAQSELGANAGLSAQLSTVATGLPVPAASGTDEWLDPSRTVASALHCVHWSTSLEQALLEAVRLGGDTDTVAALVGGLMGSRMTPTDVRNSLPWHIDVVLPDASRLTALATALSTRRVEIG
jgi:ADP-ribosylglycohydrolase/tetratricopeptide (TPR) repeat protein